jgi:hypothetical protein
LAERFVRDEEAESSNLFTETISPCSSAWQERVAWDDEAAGSNPVMETIEIKEVIIPMETIYDLLHRANFEKLFAEIQKIESDADKNSYLNAYKDMMELDPRPNDGHIFVYFEADNYDVDDDNRITCDTVGNLELFVPTEIYEYKWRHGDYPNGYAYEMDDWAKVLGTPILSRSVQEYDIHAILAALMVELTFFGYSYKEQSARVKKETASLKKIMDEFDEKKCVPFKKAEELFPYDPEMEKYEKIYQTCLEWNHDIQEWILEAEFEDVIAELNSEQIESRS